MIRRRIQIHTYNIWYKCRYFCRKILKSRFEFFFVRFFLFWQNVRFAYTILQQLTLLRGFFFRVWITLTHCTFNNLYLVDSYFLYIFSKHWVCLYTRFFQVHLYLSVYHRYMSREKISCVFLLNKMCINEMDFTTEFIQQII